MRNHPYENGFDLHENDHEMHENETACGAHFHMKGFTQRVVLKQRPAQENSEMFFFSQI